MPGVWSHANASFAIIFNKVTPILAILVLLANVYRRFIVDAGDPYKCHALVNDGQWLDSPDRNPDQRPFHNWQPEGCLLYDYGAPEIAACNEEGKILFVGDAFTRQVFWAAAKKIEGDSRWTWEEKLKPDAHVDVEFEVDGARLHFLWDPWLNSSALHEELRAFRKSRSGRNKVGDDSQEVEGWMNGTNRTPVAILIGGGLWHARHYKDDAVTHYQHSLDAIISSAYGKEMPADLTNVPGSGEDGIGNEIFFAPLIEPLYDKLSPSREAMIVPDKVDAMNRYLRKESNDHGINVLWSYTNMTKSHPQTYQESGLHVTESVASEMAEVLLNVRCNAKAMVLRNHSHNRTCCSGYKSLNWVQVLGMICTAMLLVVVKVINRDSRSTSVGTDRPGTSAMAQSMTSPITSDHNPSVSTKISCSGPTTPNPTLATLVLFLCAYYCFLADRTQVFEKISKQFSNLDFRLLLGIGVLGCLVYIKRVQPSPNRHRQRTPTSPGNTPFLSRAQSDEFKGWMQVYILIYGYTGASSVLDFYEVFRVFVAFYLFLSGYGHTMYFLQRRDYSLRRVAFVLLRLNALTTLLSFMLDTPHLAYHFAPLVSLWFLVIYITLIARCGSNDSPPLLLGKIVVSAFVTTCLIHVPGILESSFAILRYTCRADLDVELWRHHLGMDKYVVYVGMVVAMIHIRIRSILRTPVVRLNGMSYVVKKHFDLLRLIAIGLALITVPTFWIKTRRLHNTEDFDAQMPYIAWLPIVSFVVLRNATKFLRSYYCASFAWLGRVSLELYVLSHHLWLAGDGSGLLRVGFRGDGTFLNDRWRDLVFLTLILVWAAWRVRAATATVVAQILKSEDGEDISLTTHGRTKSEPQAQQPASGLPAPASSVDRKRNLNKTRRGSALPREVKTRLLILVAVVWLASVLY